MIFKLSLLQISINQHLSLQKFVVVKSFHQNSQKGIGVKEVNEDYIYIYNITGNDIIIE